jgi:mRNA interferase RelE/StbE
MTYRVVSSETAARQFNRLDRQIQKRISDQIESLAKNPRPPGVKKLKGYRDYWRIRLGDYRVIYTIQDDCLLVCVIRIGHRREVYS